jgi:hypothetical protein
MIVFKLIKNLFFFNLPMVFLKSKYCLIIVTNIMFISCVFKNSLVNMLITLTKTSNDTYLNNKFELKQRLKILFGTYDNTIQNEVEKIEYINRKIDLTVKYFHFLVVERIKIEKFRQITFAKKIKKTKLDMFQQIEVNNNNEVIDKKIKKIHTCYYEIQQLVKEYNILKTILNNNIKHLKINKSRFIMNGNFLE